MLLILLTLVRRHKILPPRTRVASLLLYSASRIMPLAQPALWWSILPAVARYLVVLFLHQSDHMAALPPRAPTLHRPTVAGKQRQ